MNQRSQNQVFLIGNPNAGKTLLFNRLSDSSAKVANYPGVTVESRSALLRLPLNEEAELIDLPGIYSLTAQSEDEEITLKLLKNSVATSTHRRLWVVVADAMHLERHLYLVLQLQRFNMPMVVAITMMDVAKKAGITLNLQALSRRLDLPVVGVSGVTGEGLEALKKEIAHSLVIPGLVPGIQAQSDGGDLDPGNKSRDDKVKEIQKAYEQVDAILQDVYQKPKITEPWTIKIDRFMLHPVLGPILLICLALVMFQLLFSIAAPMANLIDSLKDTLTELVKQKASPNSIFASLIADGIIGGVGSVLAFVPLIALLFLFLGALEDSGILARISFLLDRLLSKFGLPGRSVMPMLSGFACAVPAITATRIIPSKKARLITIMVLPFLACSARLPIFGLIIAALFTAEFGAIVMLSLYALGIVAALGSAWIFHRLLPQACNSEEVLELPPYRLPKTKALWQNVRGKTQSFLQEAGTVILAMTVIIWALLSFPIQKTDNQLVNSYAGRLGHFIEPVIAPLGFDWKIGIGLVASFAAREVFVSTLGVVYGLSASEDETSVPLKQAILADRHAGTGKPVYTPLVGLSLLAFYALAMQCMSTLAVTRKETRSLKWPFIQFAYMTGLAWFCSFAIFQIGSWMGY